MSSGSPQNLGNPRLPEDSPTDWGAPTLHGRRPDPPVDDASAAVHTALATGMLAAAADPLAGPGAGLSENWSAVVLHSGQAGRSDGWSSTTYSGPRGHRPSDRSAGVEQAGIASAPAATVGVPSASAAADAPATAAEAEPTLLASSRTMAIASLVSRLTGLLRTAAIAAALGTTAAGVTNPARYSIADPYNVANSLPNMVYELLVGGVLSSVLIPLIVYAQEHDADRGERYTQRLLSIATAVLGVATLLAVLAAPFITDVVVGEASKRQLTTIFATLLLPEIFFYGVGALIMAVLNSRNVYGPPAWAPVLNNVIVIATLGLFVALPGGSPTIGSITDSQILVLGIGTTLGIVAQAVVLLPYLRRTGLRWQWRFRAGSAAENTRLAEVRTLALWVLAYVAASQVGVVVIQRIGTSSPSGYTIFINADLLFQVPYGVLGVSLLTALMPRMSRSAAVGDIRGVLDDLNLGARLSAVALLPVTFGLMVLGPSLTTTILLGHFGTGGAREVGVLLALSSFGLLPFALVMLQMRVFYAMRDARMPTLINFGMVGTKVTLVLVAAVVLPSARDVVRALAVSTSLSYVVGAVLGYVFLRRRLGTLGFRAVAATAGRIGAASIAGAAAAAAVVWAIATVVHAARWAALTSLVLGTIAGTAVLAGVAWRLRIPELQDIWSAIRPGTRQPSADVAPSDSPH